MCFNAFSKKNQFRAFYGMIFCLNKKMKLKKALNDTFNTQNIALNQAFKRKKCIFIS